MVDPKEMLATLVDRVATTARVQTLFGDPIEAHGRTIVPVARVTYRLGAGGGGGGEKRPEGSGPQREGGGGGGAGIVKVRPVGVVEITEAGARFVRIFDPQMATGLIAGGIMIGLLMRRLFRRK